MSWRRHFLVLFLGLVLPLSAVPIIYTDTLSDGIAVTGIITQPNGQPSNPVGAVYYAFYANAGSPVTVTGRRLSGPYDMAFWVFAGLFSDTNSFGSSFGSGGAGFIGFGDDQLPPFIPGPFGDPRVSFVADSTGFYTVAVTNFASSGTPPYSFRLEATGISQSEIPEPGAGVLAGLGLFAFWAFRRR